MTFKHPPHTLIGFTGRAGSGKTTVANRVKERLRVQHKMHRSCVVEVAKFAAPIRDMLRVVGVHKGDELCEEPHPLFRSAAQFLGSWFREADADFWVNTMLNDLAGRETPTIVLLDDVRFDNEAETCDLVVRLTCTTRDGGLTPEQFLHESEREWQKIPARLGYMNEELCDVDTIARAVVAEILAMKEGK